MPAVLSSPPAVRSPKAIVWTREDCTRLTDAGLLPERYELVEGEIISRMGQNLPHGNAVMQILSWLMSLFGGKALLTHTSIDVAPADNPTSEPEPDITVLNTARSNLSRNPAPADISLLVEVSDTTLSYDLSVKRDLYARAGIAEYWVVDVNGKRVHVFRRPAAGAYRESAVVDGGQLLAPLVKPANTVPVSELLG